MAKRTDNTMAKRTDNTMAKRTDNTMAKRTDNTMAKRTDNTMAKRKRTKRQTMIYKTIHRKLNIEQHEPQSPLLAHVMLPISTTGTCNVANLHYWHM